MKSLLRFGLAVSAALLISNASYAQKPGEQSPNDFSAKITKTVSSRYLLYLPKDYGKNSKERWPLMLFLHGAGERGSDLEKLKAHGPPMLISKGQELPFIVVSPQCPENERWEPDVLIALLDSITKKYKVDKDRIYLTGLSMGGYGTWALATAYPERFAAIVPICGGGNPQQAARLKEIPTWVFHGGKDPVVPIQQSEEMVTALKAAGGNVKFTVYPEAGHDSWVQAYNDPELFKWFLAQSRHKNEKR
jgi:predicted peptidase